MRKLLITLLVAGLLLPNSVALFAQDGGTSGLTPPAPQLQSDVRDCIEQTIPEDRLKIILADTTQATDAERAAIQACMSTPPKNDSGDDHHTTLDPQVQACLIAAVGQARFDAISSGQSKPTDAEEQAGHACFDKHGDRAPKVTEGKHMTDAVKQCIDLAIGHDRFEQIMEGKITPTEADRTAAQTCFGAPVGPMNPDIQQTMNPQLKACLVAAVGQTRFDAITTGANAPTAAELAAGKKCIDQFEENDSTDAILPPAPQEVPFLEIHDNTVSIKTQSIVKKNGKNVVNVNGKAKPNSIVDLHIFSKGTTVTVKTNSKGVWSYSFNRSLAKGKHRIFASSKVGTKNVRSASHTFILK